MRNSSNNITNYVIKRLLLSDRIDDFLPTFYMIVMKKS